MKKYRVTINNTLIEEERQLDVNASNPQDAHKDVLWDLNEYDEIVEIRNPEGVLVYGEQGFVNALRDVN